MFYDVNYLLTSFSYKGPVKFDVNFWIRFLDSKFKNNAISCVEKFQSFLNSNLYLQKHYPLVKSLLINCTPRNSHRVCNDLVSCRIVVSCYVWHQTKKSSWLAPLSCRVACCRVVSCRTCVN